MARRPHEAALLVREPSAGWAAPFPRFVASAGLQELASGTRRAQQPILASRKREDRSVDNYARLPASCCR
jgi:hypothetical protein